ncbi:hypothetical protein A1O3_09375 [Capronia epimyces CBS 606.96]|uniref:Uncharacterized protein n=1 Tax=Capronia epimyces CBS 606.96 TaxID=1182542 RepID=W9Y720_9EURO|nr:uncharacterized protein A1O3_09375 [Capronia epimyces CBS 606.96]EXJ78214.1 hypothetical protein A1O3_09375 [Capronia epimyces CBS 606.96]
MSNLFDTAWALSEKIVLLTNIIQDAGHDVPSLLLQSMAERNIQPRWNEIALPAGRSLSACQKIYHEMLHMPLQPHRSFSAIVPAYAPQPLIPSLAQVRAVSEHELQPPTHRSIQPRPPQGTDSPMPPTTNGEAFTILRPFAPEPGVERRKKRGRPTKEEAEERDRRLAAAGQTYEPKRRSAKKARLSGTPGSLSEPRPGTSPGLPTAMSPRAEHIQEASSEKQRPRQATKQEESPEHAAALSPLDDSGNERSTDAAQSPSDRLLLRSGERAQTTATVSRHMVEAQSPSIDQKDPEQKHGDQPAGPSCT